MWLFVDVFLNGKVREYVYNELLEHFSYGWEDLRWFLYAAFAVLLFGFLLIYFIIPNMIIERAKKKEIQKLKAFITDHFESDDIGCIDSEYAELKDILTAQKLRSIESERKRNEMISNIAHDLKTPLTSILGYLMLLNDEDDLPEDIRKKYTSISVKKAEQLNLLVSEFFELSQYSFENIDINRSKINITQLIEQLIDEFYPILEQTGHEIVYSSHEDIYINADGNKICRALENIIKNAIYYSDGKNEIEITPQDLADCVILTISNYSKNISKEQLDRLFDRSYRIDSSRSFNGNGGLGLPIAKEIIEAHKGDIKATYSNGRFSVRIKIYRS